MLITTETVATVSNMTATATEADKARVLVVSRQVVYEGL